MIKDAHGTVLVTGHVVAMVKDLKLKGNSKVLKAGMKSKPIRIVDVITRWTAWPSRSRPLFEEGASVADELQH